MINVVYHIKALSALIRTTLSNLPNVEKNRFQILVEFRASKSKRAGLI